MSDHLIFNARIVTPQKILDRGWLICRAGRISAIGNGDPAHKSGYTLLDAQGKTLLPGFIDVHAHGAMGHDTMDASPAALIAMSHYYARHGVTSFLATTWSDTTERITDALQAVKHTIKHPDLHANLIGAHLEGPFLNPAYAGAQPIAHIRRATAQETRPWLDLGVIRLITLAPEYDENLRLLREAVAMGITMAVGHSDATYDHMQTVISQGLTHSAHTFNAMRPLHHREPGVSGAVLEAGQVGCELIADGVHVHDGAIALLWQLKRPDKLMLISDNIRIAGLGDGDFLVDGVAVNVRDGVARLADGTLSGSTVTIDVALRRFMNAVRAPIEAVWQTTSLNPARAVHVAHRKGSIEIGKDADFVLMDDAMQVQCTMVGGRMVYER